MKRSTAVAAAALVALAGASPESPAAGAVSFRSATPGVTPFISLASFDGAALSGVSAVSFTIAPQPHATARPVHATYTIAALQARGDAPAGGPLTLPIFGLYAGVKNPVTVTFDFTDGTSQTMSLDIATPAYVDPTGIYTRPTVLAPRTSAKLGFDYLYVKSTLESPVVIDTDAQVRWVGGPFSDSFSSTFDNGVFMIGGHSTPDVYDMQLDGTVSRHPVDDPAVVEFNHNIAKGRDGYLTGVNRKVDGVLNIQSTIAEMTLQGHVLREWDFAKIIGDYMRSQGDDPSTFVLPGVNWIHINSSLYDPSDDSLVISSRQQFVMKVDYDTQAIRWIFGDPTKYWHTFASLRAKAITLSSGHFYPIGQHGINLQPDGSFWMFNNGAPTSAGGVPKGAPLGDSRAYSAASAYTVDPVLMTATEVYRYDHHQTLKSPICGSAYEEAGPSMIIDYASADDTRHTHLVALDSSNRIAFEYQYANHACGTDWHTIPIPFEDLTIR